MSAQILYKPSGLSLRQGQLFRSGSFRKIVLNPVLNEALASVVIVPRRKDHKRKGPFEMDTEHWDIIRAHQRAWPVQMEPLASDLGVKVYRVDVWPDNVSGRIYKSALRGGHAGYAIDVNGAHPEVRRRFTMAHDLAHFLLHRQYIGEGIYDDALYRSGLPSAMETQANSLAAEILMPHHLLTAAVNQGIQSPEALARAFQVSEAAMQIRLGT